MVGPSHFVKRGNGFYGRAPARVDPLSSHPPTPKKTRVRTAGFCRPATGRRTIHPNTDGP
jgi:hypothetical protein